MNMRWITTKVLWLTLLATTMSFAMVVGTVLFTAYLSNRQAARDSIEMMKGGLADIALQLAQTDVSAAFGDRIPQILIVSPSGAQPVIVTQKRDAPPSMMRNPNAAPASKNNYFFENIDGRTHVVAIVRGATNTYVAQPLTTSALTQLGKTFLVDDLQVSATPVDAKARLPLRDLHGSKSAFLIWSPAQPGATTIDLLMMPVSVGLSLFLVLSIGILRGTRFNAKALDARVAETTLIARRDTLTDLPNRTAFGEHLTDLMHASQHEVSVLVMDINGFKRINDVAGHAVGDEFIAILSLQLQEAMTSHGFLARVGGDEFRVVFGGFSAVEERDQFFEKLRLIQSKQICIDDRPFKVSMAVGHALGFAGQTTAADLIRFADLAMYEAKNKLLDVPLAYHDGIESDQAQKQRIEDALRKALATGEEFEVHYQPIICARTGKMVLAEALMRWKSSELGRMSPDRFIPIAENSGLIIALGKSLLNQVCTDLRSWSDLQVAVNLSPAQLRDPNFMEGTAQIIARHGIQPSRIEFELTEGIFVEDPVLASTKLAELRKMGHRISLDDFGTGFSSIGYLRQIRFDKLKIDKTFIDDLGTTPNAVDLLSSLALLAKSFNLKIVAEGVERESQYETLYDLGYDYIQGFYCGRAMTFFDLFSIFTGQLSETKGTAPEIAKAS